MFRLLLDYLVSLLSILAALVTIYLFAELYFPTIADHGKVAVLFVGAFAVWFFLEALWLRASWGRDRMYAQVLPTISNGFSHIHDVVRDYQSEPAIPADKAVRACERFTESVADAYTRITGTECSVAIKVLAQEEESGDLYTITFARNSRSEGKRKHNDGTQRPSKHYIQHNTDFRAILENVGLPEGRFFLCNHLPFRYRYENTSFSTYGQPGDNPISRFFKWPLPYRSTIVVPICPDIADKKTHDNLAGFLCVDSPRSGAFKTEYDVDLLIGLADGLYNLLNRVERRPSGDSADLPAEAPRVAPTADEPKQAEPA